MSASNNPRQASTFLKLVPASRLKLKVKSVRREGGHQTGHLIVFSTEGGGEGYLVVSLIDQVIFGNINTADTVYRVDNCGWKYFGCILMYEIDLRHRYWWRFHLVYFYWRDDSNSSIVFLVLKCTSSCEVIMSIVRFKTRELLVDFLLSHYLEET